VIFTLKFLLLEKKIGGGKRKDLDGKWRSNMEKQVIFTFTFLLLKKIGGEKRKDLDGKWRSNMENVLATCSNLRYFST
jgi:hypothetical protein